MRTIRYSGRLRGVVPDGVSRGVCCAQRSVSGGCVSGVVLGGLCGVLGGVRGCPGRVYAFPSVDRIPDTRLWKHYLSATTVADGDKYIGVQTWYELYGTRKFLPSANEVWGKVISLHLSVILFTGRGGIPACIAGGIPACLAAGGVLSQHALQQLEGGACSQGRFCSRGVCSWGGSAPEGGSGGDPPRTATAVGGTHPTGMHSCFY